MTAPARSGERRATRLTRAEMSGRGGCQCKLGGIELEDLLTATRRRVSTPLHPLAVEHFEDCAHVECGPVRLLASTDLAPIVGVDLEMAGRIAALHAMSDIYASGGAPRWALVNLVLAHSEPIDYAEALLAGIHLACLAEGVAVIGGQTIVGHETLAGLTVIGEPSPDRLLRKRGALPGDGLFVSKPIGTGIVLRGYKLGLLEEEDLNGVVTAMACSNGHASKIAVQVARASTDISGFGLLGHLAEMLGSSLGANIRLADVPMHRGAVDVPPHVWETAWIQNNRHYVSSKHTLTGTVDGHRMAALLDPQTNGGLLVAAPPGATSFLTSRGFSRIGSVNESTAIHIDTT
jgi:selenide, water dikinase